MANKGQTTVSMVIDTEVLKKVDRRAAQMDLNRSQYFRRLAKRDMLINGRRLQTAVRTE